MAISTEERKQAGREALAWLSFAVFLMATMGFGAIFLFRDVPAYLGYDMQRTLSGWEAIVTTVVALLVMCVLVYLAVILWLLFAKMVFTRAEVSKIVFYGPTTSVERWLVDRLFPKDVRGNRG